MQCARRAGIDEAAAHAVWRELARFAAYAFCKAHAAGYGTLAYHGAYLKTHFPAEYAVGILNHHAGMYETWVHVEDLRRQGVRFLAPCLQRSAWDATLEDAPAVRVGLSRVFGVGETTGARILRARARRPFASLADVTERASHASRARVADPGRRARLTGRTRPTLLLEARTAAATAAPRPSAVATLVDPGGVELLPEPRAPIAVPTLPEFDAAERVRGERGACGLWFSGHPLDAIDDAAPSAASWRPRRSSVASATARRSSAFRARGGASQRDQVATCCS